LIERLPLLLALMLAGCPPANDDDSAAADDDDSTEEPREPTWENVFALVSFRCACHSVEEQDGGFYDLTDPDTAWDALVNVPSEDLPSMDRVEPGDPDASYVVAKIEDRQDAVGGRGDRMPPTGFALPADDITLIRDWITGGADQ